MTENFEQISSVSGFMHHNGGLYFREISENEYEFKATIKEFHLNKRELPWWFYLLIDRRWSRNCCA
tara:strand:- start:132 stop:329 length:198 start_codon:yes stop_codon:yes gene_type:complete